MNLQKQAILNRALNNLSGSFGEKAFPIEHLNIVYPEVDAVIRLLGRAFACIVVQNVTPATFQKIKHRLPIENESLSPLLIADSISPSLFHCIEEEEINIIDGAGNYSITYLKNKNIVFKLVNKGEKRKTKKSRVHSPFQDAGIKLIFYLLQKDDNVNKPYRTLHAETDVSLGSIKNILNELSLRNLLLVTAQKRVLKNKRKLLDLWSENYVRILKPKLLLDRFRFNSPREQSHWREIQLPQGMVWGGEPAASNMTTFLEPGAFEIYTSISPSHLLKTGMFVPDVNGNVFVYNTFWKDKTNSISPVLVYADLMGTEDSRCIETTNILLHEKLSDFE